MELGLVSHPSTPAGSANWLSQTLLALGRCPDSISDEGRLIKELFETDAAGLVVLAERLDDDAAVKLYKIWLGIRVAVPDSFAAWFNLGVILMRQRNFAEARIAYENALVLKPDLHAALVNLGLAHDAAGQRNAALQVWRRALPDAQHSRLLHLHSGRLLEEDGRLEEAARELTASLRITPDQPDVQQHFVHLRQRMAEWPVTASPIAELADTELARNCGPLATLALHDDPAFQRQVNATWIARKVPPAPELLAPQSGYAHDKIRIGYLSSDFCRHAMSYLIAEVLELHDRELFEVFGYCNSPEDGSETRARVRAAFDRFIPIGGMDDETAARQIRADEVDILIDLNGLTKGARLGVLRWKPAPVQVTYLGYIGPIPLPELDWMLCDDVAIPADLAEKYAPRPLPLPGCYQANDSRPYEVVSVSRAEEGLPEAAFVFCCFSHHYKITPRMFGAWLDILEATPGSVLWLIDDGAVSQRNLTSRWTERGLAPERLIFAPRVEPELYRARMALGDLFLDTSPYNAGTIASDALREGLPILTLRGQAFAARMATSLLNAMGLHDLIADSIEDFVERAVGLALDRKRHADLLERLGEDLWRRTLGDTPNFTRRLEAAYRNIAL